MQLRILLKFWCWRDVRVDLLGFLAAWGFGFRVKCVRDFVCLRGLAKS